MQSLPLIETPRCGGCHRPFDTPALNIKVGLVCGCTWHAGCLDDGVASCAVHKAKRGWSPIRVFNRIGTCAYCNKPTAHVLGNPLTPCHECTTQIDGVIHRTLNRVESQTMKTFYSMVMRAGMWPAFFRDIVDVDDVDHTGIPHGHMHPLMETAWRVVARHMMDHPTIAYVQNDTTIWAMGQWLEAGFRKLPARNYDVRVITTLSEYRDLGDVDEQTIVDTFKRHIHDSKNTEIITVRQNVIRKRTSLNICSAEDLYSALQSASFTGLLREDIYKESKHAQKYLEALGDRVVADGDRIYCAKPIAKIPGFNPTWQK